MGGAYPTHTQTLFASLGILFLLSVIRTFTSTLYMSLYGDVPNETVGAIALGVFAASILATPVGMRFGPRRSIGLSGALLVGAVTLASAWRWNWADIALGAAGVAAGTWWLALAGSARAGTGSSPLVAGLPIALAADLALRALGRTVPVVELGIPVAPLLAVVGALLFLAAGIASDAEVEWTSPGPRGALALLAIPPLLLVGETGALNPAEAALAGGLARGPEPAGSWYVVAAALGLGMTTGALVLARGRPPRRLAGAAAIGAGAVLLWAHVWIELPLAGTIGAMVLAGGVLVAATVLPDTAARPAGSPLTATVGLALGWVAFVGLAFVFYAYYALVAAPLIAAALVVLGIAASLPLPSRGVGLSELAAVAVLGIFVPTIALLTPPGASPGNARGSTFRLMTYNVHQGFDEGNVPSLDRIADVIRAEDPDVVVLQEVTRGWMITDQHDVLTVLSERLAMPYVFGPAIGDVYGNAVLSRLPMTDVSRFAYPREPLLRHQPRGGIVLTVSGVLVIATHLDHVAGASDVRQRQVRTLLTVWNGRQPAVVAGDLNALPGTPELGLLEAAGFRDLAKDDGADQPTSPASGPVDRVDYVWGIGVRGTQAHTVTTTASDHRPLVINISRP